MAKSSLKTRSKRAPAADAAQEPNEDTVDASTAEAQRKKRKQAVVIVHGMGEQKPLETLRGFVESVWGGRPVPRSDPHPDDVWLVPDTRAGLTELARVTTRRDETTKVATDFYELYWSDLLVGNTRAQLQGWVTGLLLRWPHQVPRETFVHWVALWVLVALIVALAAYVGLTASLAAIKELFADMAPIRNGWTAAAGVMLTAATWWFLGKRLAANLKRWDAADIVFPGIWAGKTPKQASASVALSRALRHALPIVIGVAAYLYFPWSVLCLPKTWAVLVAAALAVLLTGWVVPVFGDVARYVRTSPDAVEARASIRGRGLELVRALHGPRADDRSGRYDYGDAGRYERIVVVGHSLGSIIAYDILRLFWEERGPTRLNEASPEAKAALQRLDDFCRAASAPGQTFDMSAFRTLQKAVADALGEQPDGWKISDFVTLGSPLTHAEFLVSRDRAAFEERKAERLFPTCPPMLEPSRRPSFLYPAGERAFAHHAAMFAAMRWTNIHDTDRVPVFGDFISGPCAPNFGPGVLDVAIKLDRGGPFGRLVTHTDYWNMDASGRASDAEGKKLGVDDVSSDPKAHITLLRRALALRGQPR